MKIDKPETLVRTIVMLHREFGIPVNKIAPASSLRADLLLNNAQIGGLKGPIESFYFADVNAKVTPLNLIGAQTVSQLSGVIWAGIPAANRKATGAPNAKNLIAVAAHKAAAPKKAAKKAVKKPSK